MTIFCHHAIIVKGHHARLLLSSQARLCNNGQQATLQTSSTYLVKNKKSTEISYERYYKYTKAVLCVEPERKIYNRHKLVCPVLLPHFRIRAGSPGSPGNLRLGVLLFCERVLYCPPFDVIALPLLRNVA